MSAPSSHPKDPRLTAPTGVKYTPSPRAQHHAPSQTPRSNSSVARFFGSATTDKPNPSASIHIAPLTIREGTYQGTNSTHSAAATRSQNDLSVQHNNAMAIDNPSPTTLVSTKMNGVHITPAIPSPIATSGADGSNTPTEPVADLSITVMFGPAEFPDQNLMTPQTTAKLPRKVLETMMRSKSSQRVALGGHAFLLRFTNPYWYQSLIKVNEYLSTGDYAPRKPLYLLEIVDKNGRKFKWSPELRTFDKIAETTSTEETYLMFMGELNVYKWARYTHYDELKEHALQRIFTEYPVFARECLAVVELLCAMIPEIALEESMKHFITEAVERNKRQIAALPGFSQALDKAIGDNLLVRLLQHVQQEAIQSLQAEIVMSRLSVYGSQPSQRGNNIPAAANVKQEEPPTDPQLGSSPMSLESGSSAQIPENTLLLHKVQDYIERGRLVKARSNGWGTLLPPKQGARTYVGPRNKEFRVREGEVLLIDHTICSFNVHNNIVVENKFGQRGDMIKGLFTVLTFPPLQEEPSKLNDYEVRTNRRYLTLAVFTSEPPTAPRAMQLTDKTHKHVKSEGSSGQFGEEESRQPRRRSRSRSPSRSRSRSLDYKGRRPSRRSRSPPRHIDRYPAVYGRR